MQGGKTDSAYNPAGVIGPALLCLFAAACTPSGGSSLATGVAGNPVAPTIPGIMAEVASQSSRTPGAVASTGGSPQAVVAGQTAAAAQAGGAPASPTTTTVPSTASQAMASAVGGDAILPEQVSYVPTPSPADTVAAMPQSASASSPAQAADANAGEAASDAAVQTIMASVAAPVPMPRPAIAEDGNTQSNEAEAAPAVTAFTTPAKPVQPQKKGFFALLFGGASTAQKSTVPQPASSQPAQPSPTQQAAAVPTPSPSPIPQGGVKPLIDENAPARPIVQLVSAQIPASPLAASGPARSPSGSDNALPGVRSQSSLFEITRKSGTGDDSDVDISEDDNEPVRVASAGGLARLDPHGLLLQRQTVDTACLKPGLVGILKEIEQHFGHKLIVTSGYRSPVHNAAAHGALNSLHMFCAAADVQMPGVSKWQLADYARSLPGRGGVGTYCYTDSVHIDIGPERDWNWRCRRRHRR